MESRNNNRFRLMRNWQAKLPTGDAIQFEEFEIPGDGHCGFHCLAALEDSEQNKLRKNAYKNC